MNPEIIRSCKACPLGDRGGGVPGEYVPDLDELYPTKTMVVLEAPGGIEQEVGRPVWGDSGQMFRQMMEECGVTDYYVTNTVKHRPWVVKGKQQAPDAVAQAACRPFLMAEFKMVQPTKVIVCGKVAAKAVLGDLIPGNPSLTAIVNRVYNAPEFQVLVLYHPAYFLHNRTAVWVRKQVNDWKRALRNFMGADIPHYNIERVACLAHD